MPRPSTTTFLYTAIVSLGGFLFGLDVTVISGALGFVTRQFELDAWQRGLVVSAPTLAATVAALTVGPLADRLGRRRVLQMLAGLYLMSSLASALAPGFQALVVARCLGGYAFGTLLLAPLYIAEISPARLRGRLVSVNQLNIVVGFSVAYFTNYALLELAQSSGFGIWIPGAESQIWRWMFGFETIPAIAYFLLLFLVPESPRWLMARGRQGKARQVLARLTAAERLDGTIAEIRQGIAESARREPVSFREMLRPSLRFPLTLGLIVGVAQQITGVNAIYFYAPTIFEQSGVGTNAALAQAVWVGLTNVVFTLVAMLLIDRLGRKPLLVLGLAGVLCSLGLAAHGFDRATFRLEKEAISELLAVVIPGSGLESLAGIEYADDLSFKRALEVAIGKDALRDHEALLIQTAIDVDSVLILAGILGFVASFAVSLGPVMWVLLSEIFPNRVRGLAMSLVTFFNSLISFGVQFFFPWQISNIGSSGTFLVYGGFAVVALILVVWLLPETKGRSLEQLEQDLAA